MKSRGQDTKTQHHRYRAQNTYDKTPVYPVLKDEHEMHDEGDGLYRPFTLGRLGLPDRLPFSDCQVKAILQVDAGGSGEPMSESNSDAIDKERIMG